MKENGDVYYQRDGEVRSFGTANRILALVIALFCLSRIIKAFSH
jgi:hypothetical protein